MGWHGNNPRRELEAPEGRDRREGNKRTGPLDLVELFARRETRYRRGYIVGRGPELERVHRQPRSTLAIDTALSETGLRMAQQPQPAYPRDPAEVEAEERKVAYWRATAKLQVIRLYCDRHHWTPAERRNRAVLLTLQHLGLLGPDLSMWELGYQWGLTEGGARSVIWRTLRQWRESRDR